MSLEPGTNLGRYQIISLIGSGGMGEVYRARDTRLDRDVAIKVLPVELAQDATFRRRLEREAKVISQLQHPNVCTLYDFDSADGSDFLVMELLEGESLEDRIERGPISIAEALRIGAEVAEGIEAAHRRGVVHRDLKPGNVMLTGSGAKVLDFGLARDVAAPGTAVDTEAATLPATITEEGRIVGTMPYMAPEQLQGRAPDRRTDIWALGCLLYELATRERAFQGESRADLTAAILSSVPEPPSRRQPLAPGRLDLVVRRCLEKDPERRWQSARDVAIELEEIVGLPPQPDGSARRRPWLPLLAGGLALGVAVAGAAVWLVLRSPESPPPVTSQWILPLSTPSEGSLSLDPSSQFEPFAVSPGGQRIVFGARASSVSPFRLYLYELREAASRVLPGTEGAGAPFFSPNGRWIGFWAGGRLAKILASGSAPVDIGPASWVGTALWGEGDRIFFSGGGYPGGLFSIDAGGGVPVAVPIQYRNSEAMAPLSILDGGRSLLVLTTRDDAESTLESVAVETGERRHLAPLGRADNAILLASDHLLFSERGAWLAVPLDPTSLQPVADPVPIPLDIYTQIGFTPFRAISDTGTLVYLPTSAVREPELLWVDRGGNRESIPGGVAPIFNAPFLSPEGDRLVAQLSPGRQRQIWIFDLVRGTRSLLAGEGQNRTPVWTPDGSAVTYQANGAGIDGVVSKPIESDSGPTVLFERGQAPRPFPMSWSPDGRHLAFLTYPAAGTGRDVWLYSDGEVSPLLDTPFDEDNPVFSPDGRFIAFDSDDTGRQQVYVRPFSEVGTRHQVSTEGGRVPRWHPGGRELYYRQGRNLMAVTVELEPALSFGNPEVLFEGSYRAEFDVAPAGDRFLMVSKKEVQKPVALRVVLNWFSELERLVPTD